MVKEKSVERWGAASQSTLDRGWGWGEVFIYAMSRAPPLPGQTFPPTFEVADDTAAAVDWAAAGVKEEMIAAVPLAACLFSFFPPPLLPSSAKARLLQPDRLRGMAARKGLEKSAFDSIADVDER
jgi:hypothetical protein